MASFPGLSQFFNVCALKTGRVTLKRVGEPAGYEAIIMCVSVMYIFFIYSWSCVFVPICACLYLSE